HPKSSLGFQGRSPWLFLVTRWGRRFRLPGSFSDKNPIWLNVSPSRSDSKASRRHRAAPSPTAVVGTFCASNRAAYTAAKATLYNNTLILLEPIVQAELDDASIGECTGDLPELGRVDIVARGVEGRMIEDVAGLHAEFDSLFLGDVGQFRHAGVCVGGSGAGADATLKGTGLAGAR